MTYLVGGYPGYPDDLDTRCRVSPDAGEIRQEADGGDQQQVPGTA